MVTSDATPPFRLLLHSRDGCIPHLTPRLLDNIFCQDESDPTNEEWKSYRAHLILGIAAKDTCITPVYSNKRKRDDDNKSNGNKKRRTDDSSSVVDSSNGGVDASKGRDTKKPSGYTFLTPDKTHVICNAVRVNTSSDDDSTSESNFIHDYLRVPNYIQTMVVPTFSFAAQADDSDNSKKFISSKQTQTVTEKDKQQKGKTKDQQIPKGTQNSVAIDTPHGWQSITPEQYGGAVASLAYPSKIVSRDVGAVGLFDHLDISTQGAIALLSEDDCDTVATLKKQALKKITTSFQKCTYWSSRVQSTKSSSDSTLSLWVPVNIFTNFLPEHVLSKSFHNSTHQNMLEASSSVAIVGWENFPSNVSQGKKRTVLNTLMKTIQSMPTTGSKSSKQFLLLAVNDVQSILAAAREGVSIIGTDVVRSMSVDGVALVLDLNHKLSPDHTSSGKIDLKDTAFAKDSRPILRGCTCLACRVRKASTRPAGYQHFEKEFQDVKAEIPAFSRAYIHHLIQAREMLADTLLFVHNLHQMILLFRKLGEAHKASMLESYCEWIEDQL